MDSQDNDDCFIDALVDDEVHVVQSNDDINFPSQIQSKKKKKRENYSSEEDVLLVSAWLNTSMDPITANDQKSETFWKRVSILYNEITNSKFPIRSMLSVTNRWQVIQRAVNKFQGFLSQIETRNASGTTEKDKIDEAKVMYRSFEKCHFSFDHCWKILREEPKWMMHNSSNKRPYSGSCLRDSIDLDDNITDNNPLKSVERPIGRKAAKESLKKTRGKEKETDLGNILGDWKEDRLKMQEQKIHIHEKKLKMQEEKADKIVQLEKEKVDIEKQRIELEAEKFRFQQMQETKKSELEAQKIQHQQMQENKKSELDAQKIQHQQRQEEINIMMMDTSSLKEVQKKYFESLQAQILARSMR